MNSVIPALVIGSVCGVIGLSSCSSSPKKRDYPGYKTIPYQVHGKLYRPMSVKQALHFKQIGIASYYDESSMMGIVSGSTSIGESVHPWHMHAAHPTLPLPCEVEVYSFRTRKSIKVRVNDRGPFVKDRIIDLSDEAAKRLGFKHQGLEKVAIRVLSVGDGKWKRKAEL